MSRAACHQLVTIDEAVFGVNIQLWQRPQMRELAAKIPPEGLKEPSCQPYFVDAPCFNAPTFNILSD